MRNLLSVHHVERDAGHPGARHLKRLIYISESLVEPHSPEMLDIAHTAMRRNSQCAVTGYLYHDDDVFVQVLEGMDADVDYIYDGILRDRRHRNIRTLADEHVENRLFGGWAMGVYEGADRGGLLRRSFGPRIATDASRKDAPTLIRFLNDLSLGREGVYLLAPQEGGN